MAKIQIYILFCLLLICYHPVFSRQSSTLLPQPPNGVWLQGNLYIDKTEIENIHWLEYIYYLKRDSSDVVYTTALPDTTVWLQRKDTSMYENYLRAPEYLYYPVVGITHQQAIKYCQWRSQAASTYYNAGMKKTMDLGEDQQVFFNFRLPTEREWEAAAAGALNQKIYPYGYVSILTSSSLTGKPMDYYEKTDKTKSIKVFKDDLKKFNAGKHEPMFNVLKGFNEYFIYGDNFPRASSDKKSDPNSLGLYDMIGNVAEFVEEQGFAKGGSWASHLEASAIHKRQYYNKPQAWLGFRCVCEVALKPAR